MSEYKRIHNIPGGIHPEKAPEQIFICKYLLCQIFPYLCGLGKVWEKGMVLSCNMEIFEGNFGFPTNVCNVCMGCCQHSLKGVGALKKMGGLYKRYVYGNETGWK